MATHTSLTWAIIPVKSLSLGKSRLAQTLSPQERAAITQKMLRHTIDILRDSSYISHVLVVSRDPRIQRLAHQLGASSLAESATSELNGALTEAADFARQQHASQLIILPSDLPFIQAEDIETMLFDQPTPGRSISICADQAMRGTNGLRLPADVPFIFQFGIASFDKHIRQIRQLNLPPVTILTEGLQFDLDTRDDWHHYLSSTRI